MSTNKGKATITHFLKKYSYLVTVFGAFAALTGYLITLLKPNTPDILQQLTAFISLSLFVLVGLEIAKNMEGYKEKDTAFWLFSLGLNALTAIIVLFILFTYEEAIKATISFFSLIGVIALSDKCGLLDKLEKTVKDSMLRNGIIGIVAVIALKILGTSGINVYLTDDYNGALIAGIYYGVSLLFIFIFLHTGAVAIAYFIKEVKHILNKTRK